jgi:hypothetical protein
MAAEGNAVLRDVIAFVTSSLKNSSNMTQKNWKLVHEAEWLTFQWSWNASVQQNRR